MCDAALRQFVAEARGSHILVRLEAMARNLAGVPLVAMARKGAQTEELLPSDGTAGLPEFCRIIRSTPEGLGRCVGCRSLVALGACYLGLIEYGCHGGVSVLAAAGSRTEGSDLMLVSSCAIAHSDRAKGWRLARTHARGLEIDFGKLRKAYHRLPAVKGQKLRLARETIALAACVMADIESRVLGESPPGGPCAARPVRRPEMDQRIASALHGARDRTHQPPDKPSGSTLIDLVTAMVEGDPAMPLSVAGIARAAHVTPNHFSMLFRKHTGRTFTAFVAERRIELAKQLLADVRLNIEQAAHRAGFNDAGYFTRRFKQVVGLTPSQWREGA